MTNHGNSRPNGKASSPNDRPKPLWFTHSIKASIIHVCPGGEVHRLSPACPCSPEFKVEGDSFIVSHRTKLQIAASTPVPDYMS